MPESALLRAFRSAIAGVRIHRARRDRAAAFLALTRAARYRREIALARFYYTPEGL